MHGGKNFDSPSATGAFNGNVSTFSIRVTIIAIGRMIMYN